MRGPDCHTDHYLIKTALNFAIKPAFRKTGAMKKRRLDTAKLSDERCQERLQAELMASLGANIDNEVSPDDHWKALSSIVFNTAAEVLGYTKKKKCRLVQRT